MSNELALENEMPRGQSRRDGIFIARVIPGRPKPREGRHQCCWRRGGAFDGGYVLTPPPPTMSPRWGSGSALRPSSTNMPSLRVCLSHRRWAQSRRDGMFIARVILGGPKPREGRHQCGWRRGGASDAGCVLPPPLPTMSPRRGSGSALRPSSTNMPSLRVCLSHRRWAQSRRDGMFIARVMPG